MPHAKPLPAHTQALIAAAQSGAPEAIDQLLRACKPDLRRYAQRCCLASDVDDAVQTSLLLTAQRIGQLRVAAAWSGWLFAIIRRECTRLARAVGRLVSLDALPEAELAHASAQDHALRIDLTRALESLPPTHLQVILLRDFEELGIQDIAEQTGETVACIKSRLHRARAMLREYLGPQHA